MEHGSHNRQLLFQQMFPMLFLAFSLKCTFKGVELLFIEMFERNFGETTAKQDDRIPRGLSVRKYIHLQWFGTFFHRFFEKNLVLKVIWMITNRPGRRFLQN